MLPEYDLGGFDPTRFLLHDEVLPQYSRSTLTDDKKVRSQYISFLKATGHLQNEYVDTTYASYFKLSTTTTTSTAASTTTPSTSSLSTTTPSASKHSDTNATSPPPQQSPTMTSQPQQQQQSQSNHPRSNSHSHGIHTRNMGGTTVHTIRKIHESITTVTMSSSGEIVSTVNEHRERDDLLGAEFVQPPSTSFLFQYDHVIAFINYKIKSSVENYRLEKEHTLCTKSIRER